MSEEMKNEKKNFPATVIKVINSSQIGINRGEDANVKIGQKFLLFELTREDIKDPETGNILGKLEIPKGINVPDAHSEILSCDWDSSIENIKPFAFEATLFCCFSFSKAIFAFTRPIWC